MTNRRIYGVLQIAQRHPVLFACLEHVHPIPLALDASYTYEITAIHSGAFKRTLPRPIPVTVLARTH
jgi:hypothetical protein